VEGVPVDKGMDLSQGLSKKVINMDVVSNSSVTQVYPFANAIDI
jgi:hypothetical protein